MTDIVRQSQSWYAQGDPNNPRNDPTYVEKVAEILLDHRGERVHIEAVLGGDCWALNEAVNCLRRLGWEIHGERGCPGYLFVKWTRPQRWLRLDTVYRDYQAPIILRPKRPRKVEPLAGQVAWC